MKEGELTLIFWRHINISSLTYDLRLDITIFHAGITRIGLRIGSRVRHQKTVMIRHFNCPNVVMIKFIFIVDGIGSKWYFSEILCGPQGLLTIMQKKAGM